MRIAVLGAGAMGALFGGYLSPGNDVLLVDVNQALVEKINRDGVRIEEPDGTVQIRRPHALTDTTGQAPVDLMIVFVKALYSRSALENNRGLIGPDTYLMTLQNGKGHEEKLLEFADRAHVIIGTTQHNSAVGELGTVRHGGIGMTYVGCLEGDVKRIHPVTDVFNSCGLMATCSDNVQKLIWDKLFTNVSASVLTAVLQVPLGYITENPDAWSLCRQLVHEAVQVANQEGMRFNEEEKLCEVRAVCENSSLGITSIFADVRAGRRTEVDTISGSVVHAGKSVGVPVPTHEAMVHLIHALEKRKTKDI